MKKIKYLLIMAIAVMVSVSCSDDDDNDVNPLIGSWGMTEMEQGYEYTLTITFNENLNGTITTVETYDGETETYNQTFTWSTDGNKLTLIIDGYTDISTYSISGNKLTVTSDGDITVLTRL